MLFPSGPKCCVSSHLAISIETLIIISLQGPEEFVILNSMVGRLGFDFMYLYVLKNSCIWQASSWTGDGVIATVLTRR